MHHFIITCEFKLELQLRKRKRLSWVVTSVTLTFDLWSWPFAWTSLLSLVITPENFMMIRWWEHSQKGVTDRQTDGRTDRRTDGRTDWTIHRAAWSHLKYVRCPQGVASDMPFIGPQIPLHSRISLDRREHFRLILGSLLLTWINCHLCVYWNISIIKCGRIIDVSEWIRNFTANFAGHVITYPF